MTQHCDMRHFRWGIKSLLFANIVLPISWLWQDDFFILSIHCTSRPPGPMLVRRCMKKHQFIFSLFNFDLKKKKIQSLHFIPIYSWYNLLHSPKEQHNKFWVQCCSFDNTDDYWKCDPVLPSTTKGTSCRPGLWWDNEQNSVQMYKENKRKYRLCKSCISKSTTSIFTNLVSWKAC